MQASLAGEAQHVHGAAVSQRAARQHRGRRGSLVRGQELVAHLTAWKWGPQTHSCKAIYSMKILSELRSRFYP